MTVSETPEFENQTERRLAAIMFTDIAGYTTLTQTDEDHAFKLLERHNRLLRPFFSKYNGREIKSIGDSFLVEFNNALDATKCAIEIQKQLHDYNLRCEDDAWKIKLRIGVHLGDVIRAGGDIFGDSVNIASRIEPLTEPEGICVSAQVFDQVGNKVPYELRQIEHKELKNVKIPVSVYKVILPWDKERVSTTITQRSKSDGTSHRIAVLPFANMSPEENDEYFSDGITEEIISTISKIQGIEVISRTSIMRYKKSPKALKEIASELDAGIVIEGSVRKAGNKIRVTVQMINANTDAHIWSENYDRDFKDVFEIQSDIARGVASMMKSRLLDQDRKEIEKGATRNPEAHSAYLLGKYFVNRGNREDLLKGIENLKRAIGLDPSFAAAHAALSVCYTYMAGQYISDEEGFTLAREYAQRAVELDDAIAEGHVSLALVALQYDWDWEKAQRELLHAITLNPSNSTAHVWYGFYLGMTLRSAEGVEESKKAEELDPLSHIAKLDVGCLLYFAGRYDEAISKFAEAIELEKQDEMTYLFTGFCYLAKAMYDEAVAQMIKGTQAAETTNGLGGLGHAYAKAGKKGEARDTLKRIDAQGDKAFCPFTNKAIIYLGLDEYDKALDLLEEALKQGDSWLVLTFQTRIYDPVRSLPRFVQIAKRVGLPLA